MAPPLLTTALSLLTLVTPVLSHSHLAYIIVNGELYHGFDPRPNQVNQADRVGWSTGAVDDGFVTPGNYTHPDIICHIDGTSPTAHAPVSPGDQIHIQWNGWPMGHVGPVLTYLAPCGGLDGADTGCTGVDKTELRWTKVDDSLPVMEHTPSSGSGLPAGIPGEYWATDVLIAANNSWQVTVPSGLAAGPYVLRNEIIALHYAAEEDGAQNYPLCMNLWVEGGDDARQAAEDPLELDDFDATTFYTPEEPGILLNVTAGVSSYAVPGPTVAAGATPVPYESQVASISRADGTPVVVTRSTETVPFATGATAAAVSAGLKGRYNRN